MSDIAKKGAVVKLKSGGPAMTVEDEGTVKAPTLTCIWFDCGVVKRDKFLSELLECHPRKTS